MYANDARQSDNRLAQPAPSDVHLSALTEQTGCAVMAAIGVLDSILSSLRPSGPDGARSGEVSKTPSGLIETAMSLRNDAIRAQKLAEELRAELFGLK